MVDSDFRIPLQTSSPTERVFPALKPDQIERAAAHGRLRRVQEGEVVVALILASVRPIVREYERAPLARNRGSRHRCLRLRTVARSASLPYHGQRAGDSTRW